MAVVIKLKLAPVLKLLEFKRVRKTRVVIAINIGEAGIRFAA
jgi:hypothetical protein